MGAVGRRGVASVALGDIHRRFAWQAWHLGDIHHRFAWQMWHLATSTFVSRGRHGTYMGLGWLQWRAWARLVADAAALWRGRRGTWRHPPSFHVARMALGDIHLRFTWPSWHLATSSIVSRGRCGTWRHQPSFCLARVELIMGWLWRRAWARLVAVTPRHFCVAGVALGDIHLRFTWQGWHLATSTFVSHGRRGTWRHPPSFCVAGIHLRFAWQALPFLAHTTLSYTHTHLCHTQLCHTHLCHTHPLSYTTLSHTIFHTQLSHSRSSLCHTQPCHTHLSVIHNFATHHLCHT